MTGYGIGVPKGSDLMAEINEIILELQENGNNSKHSMRCSDNILSKQKHKKKKDKFQS